jgi:hypothetical protein
MIFKIELVKVIIIKFFLKIIVSGEPAKVPNLENSTTQFLKIHRGIPISDDIFSKLFENLFSRIIKCSNLHLFV